MNSVTPHALRPVKIRPYADIGPYKQLSVNYDEQQNAMWSFMQAEPRPCFTTALLREVEDFFSIVCNHDDSVAPIDYLVAASGVQGIYNLGGDLNYFRQCIESRDKEGLREYGYSCLEMGYRCTTQFDRGVTTIALIQGQAMGGGLEAALSCNFIIAEESATFGFPEVLFNLFPGMGAHVYLSRRVPAYVAQRMISSGNKYSAKEMYDMGIVDLLVKDGEGVTATTQFIKRHRSRLLAQRAISMADLIVNPISLQKLRDVNDIWVDTSMRIGPQELKTMERLIRAQGKIGKHSIES